jgi:hypothetical protein
MLFRPPERRRTWTHWPRKWPRSGRG